MTSYINCSVVVEILDFFCCCCCCFVFVLFFVFFAKEEKLVPIFWHYISLHMLHSKWFHMLQAIFVGAAKNVTYKLLFC